jgi:FkbM family methyltransferase
MSLSLILVACALTTVAMMWVPICGVSTIGKNNKSHVRDNLVSDRTDSPPAQKPSLGDGCYHVFMDVGSNKGVHGRFLFEPEKYPKSTFTKLFDHYFGKDRKHMPICVFAFEPNPLHTEHQSATQRAYKAMGWRYHYIQAAVADKDGTMTFYRNGHTHNGSTHEEWGFALVPRGDLDEARKTAITVQTVDLAAWFMENIEHRRIPDVDPSLEMGKPMIVMKMDIESAEYRTLTHLLATGVACKFNEIVGETHGDWPEPIKTRGGTKLSTAKMKTNLLKSITAVMRAEGCKPMRKFDDESYLHDGAAYPEGSP